MRRPPLPSTQIIENHFTAYCGSGSANLFKVSEMHLKRSNYLKKKDHVVVWKWVRDSISYFFAVVKEYLLFAIDDTCLPNVWVDVDCNLSNITL